MADAAHIPATERPPGLLGRLLLPLLLFCSSLTVMAGATIAPSLPG